MVCESDEKRKYILDTTLRDGEQAPGLVFSSSEKKRLAELLCSSGVDEIEAGSPVMGKKEQDFIYSIRNIGTPVSCWCRASEKDIQAAAECSTGRVHISLPVSDILLSAMSKEKDWVLEKMEIMFFQARKDFDYISLGAMDATRADIKFLTKFTEHAERLGYKRIRISDTVGITNPMDLNKLISKIRNNNIQLDFHGHNDIGMATANSITALQSGSDWVNTTLLGIGERAGNAPLEEVAAALVIDKNMKTSLDIKAIQNAVKYLSKITNEKISPRKAVVGKNVFTHESGIHYALQLRNPESFQPCRPEEFGRKASHYVLGKHSGRSSVIDFCRKQGIETSGIDPVQLNKRVRDFAEKKKRFVKQWEMMKLVKDHMNKGASKI